MSTPERLGRLDILIQPGHAMRITLAGRIDDASPLGPLGARIPAGDVTIDTSGVRFVNSIGMREWVRLLRVLRDRGTVTLERVADVLMTQMTQMNMIADLGSNVRITSFHAQYVCPACGAEGTPLVDVNVHGEALARLQAPKLPCPECRAQMELADVPERYLTVFRRPVR
ncbi:MAG: hypothetical protein H6Q90_5092 [Deltaproteobacteria bacterium]|nr:hypothetical protein [Deltaproteobacteria bacterium]